MPKIIIRENDYTQAGTPEYSNFTVLIAGFAKEGVAAGTVFEFSTQQDFVDKVGYVKHTITNTSTSGEGESAVTTTTSTVTSYGNKIAYELLGLGYQIIYKVITDIESMKEASFWNEFKDKASYDFRYIMSGVLREDSEDNKLQAQINEQMINLAHFNEDATDVFATGRGECIALLDIDLAHEAVDKIATCAAKGSKYAAYFAPSFCIKGYANTNYSNNRFPASFYYLACAKRASLNNFDEWFAVAGYTRGLANFAIESTSTNYGEIAIHKLQARTASENTADADIAVNLIANFRGNYYLWGNRTAESLGDELKASHFLNIRQLCTTIKKQIYIACRRFTFDPNSDILWVNFCNAITPTLERMKNNQGIESFVIEKVDTDLKATLKAKIRITPIEAVEDFDIELALEDSMGTANATISE